MKFILFSFSDSLGLCDISTITVANFLSYPLILYFLSRGNVVFLKFTLFVLVLVILLCCWDPQFFSSPYLLSAVSLFMPFVVFNSDYLFTEELCFVDGEYSDDASSIIGLNEKPFYCIDSFDKNISSSSNSSNLSLGRIEFLGTTFPYEENDRASVIKLLDDFIFRFGEDALNSSDFRPISHWSGLTLPVEHLHYFCFFSNDNQNYVGSIGFFEPQLSTLKSSRIRTLSTPPVSCFFKGHLLVPDIVGFVFKSLPLSSLSVEFAGKSPVLINKSVSVSYSLLLDPMKWDHILCDDGASSSSSFNTLAVVNFGFKP